MAKKERSAPIDRLILGKYGEGTAWVPIVEPLIDQDGGGGLAGAAPTNIYVLPCKPTVNGDEVRLTATRVVRRLDR